MKFLTRVRSLQAKLVLLVVLACALAAVLVGTALSALEYTTARRDALAEVRTLARIYAFNVVATMQFERYDEAVQMLEALELVEDIGVVGIYLPNEELVAQFPPEGETDVPLPASPPRFEFAEGGWYYVGQPVVDDGDFLGTLVFAYDLTAITSTRNRQLLISGLLTLLATGVALLIALRLQRSVTEPLAELLFTARRVAETQNYSIRARKQEEDELGQFTDVFNEMLGRIDQHSEALQIANERFRVAVESSPNGVVKIDEAGRIILVNIQIERMFGYDREELVGREPEILVPPSIREDVRASFQDPQSQPMGAGREFLGLRKDGSEFPIEIGLSPITTESGVSVLSSIVDITHRKKAEAAVRESEERLRTLMNVLPAIIWTADAEGRITSFNEQWYEYTGDTSEEVGKDAAERFVHPEDRGHNDTKWMHAIETGEEFQDEVRLRRRDGVYRWFMIRGVALRDDSGKVAGWFGTTNDIEDRKRAEHQRDLLLESERVARSDAERASRAKDEFVATLSHELRTPLTAILGWAQMLRRGTLGDKESTQGLEIIERNARVQTQLIEDLLDMSRIMSGKIRLDVQEVELPEVISSAIETVQPAADAKEIRLQKIIDPRVKPVHGDPDRLQQIVWNLLSNAIKFTHKGGRVQVALQRINSHIEIVVSDTGEGIPAEFLPYLFQRFRQVDPSTTRRHGGLGLGLAIVKQLVELHGGTISAASPGVGKGATFTITLPLAIMHPRDVTEVRRHPIGRGIEVSADETASLGGVKVLVVEDEPDARELIARVLQHRKAEVTAVASGNEALRVFDQVRPDVLVSDIGMPDMDGYELIRKIRMLDREAGGGIAAVALTAFARTEDRTRALLAGYQMHVAKPVDPGELIASVASLASLSRRRNGQGKASPTE